MDKGDMVFYKLAKGRGRPFVGTVVKKMGIFTEIENKINGDTVRVPTKFVGRAYEFRPYNTKSRKAA